MPGKFKVTQKQLNELIRLCFKIGIKELKFNLDYQNLNLEQISFNLTETNLQEFGMDFFDRLDTSTDGKLMIIGARPENGKNILYVFREKLSKDDQINVDPLHSDIKWDQASLTTRKIKKIPIGDIGVHPILAAIFLKAFINVLPAIQWEFLGEFTTSRKKITKIFTTSSQDLKLYNLEFLQRLELPDNEEGYVIGFDQEKLFWLWLAKSKTLKNYEINDLNNAIQKFSQKSRKCRVDGALLAKIFPAVETQIKNMAKQVDQNLNIVELAKRNLPLLSQAKLTILDKKIIQENTLQLKGEWKKNNNSGIDFLVNFMQKNPVCLALSLNYQNMKSSLHLAAESTFITLDDLKIMVECLKENYGTKFVAEILEFADSEGKTPLDYSLEKRDLEKTKYLIINSVVSGKSLPEQQILKVIQSSSLADIQIFMEQIAYGLETSLLETLNSFKDQKNFWQNLVKLDYGILKFFLDNYFIDYKKDHSKVKPLLTQEIANLIQQSARLYKERIVLLLSYYVTFPSPGFMTQALNSDETIYHDFCHVFHQTQSCCHHPQEVFYEFILWLNDKSCRRGRPIDYLVNVCELAIDLIYDSLKDTKNLLPTIEGILNNINVNARYQRINDVLEKIQHVKNIVLIQGLKDIISSDTESSQRKHKAFEELTTMAAAKNSQAKLYLAKIYESQSVPGLTTYLKPMAFFYDKAATFFAEIQQENIFAQWWLIKFNIETCLSKQKTVDNEKYLQSLNFGLQLFFAEQKWSTGNTATIKKYIRNCTLEKRLTEIQRNKAALYWAALEDDPKIWNESMFKLKKEDIGNIIKDFAVLFDTLSLQVLPHKISVLVQEYLQEEHKSNGSRGFRF